MNIDEEKLNAIRKSHNLLLILLHGSQVDGKTHKQSDIDIALVRKNDKQKINLLKIIEDLSIALKTDKVDISDLTHADPLFLYSVIKKSKLLAGKKEDYSKITRLAFHRYSDYLPYLKNEKKFVIKRIKSYVSH